MKTITYTFRTSPFKNLSPDIFVFGKLKEDFKKFSDKILNEKPQLIIGLAKSDQSRIEIFAINQYNKKKKINKKGKDKFQLYVPQNNIFQPSKNQQILFATGQLTKYLSLSSKITSTQN